MPHVKIVPQTEKNAETPSFSEKLPDRTVRRKQIRRHRLLQIEPAETLSLQRRHRLPLRQNRADEPETDHGVFRLMRDPGTARRAPRRRRRAPPAAPARRPASASRRARACRPGIRGRPGGLSSGRVESNTLPSRRITAAATSIVFFIFPTILCHSNRFTVRSAADSPAAGSGRALSL